MSVRANARAINSADPGIAYVETTPKTTMEMAVVGPETRCKEDPNRAAMIGTIMAVYNPY